MAMMRQMRAQTALLTAALLLAGLSACSGKKTEVAPPASASKAPPEDFFSIDDISGGLQTAPDEFSVLTKKPLELPDRFDVLPAPEPGKLSSRDPNPLAEAQQVLLPKSATAATANATTTLTAPSAAERVALSAAGEVDPNIRQTVAAEQAAYDSEQRLYILDRYFPILPRLRGETITGTLDPVEERKRLVEEGVLAQPLPDTPETGTTAPGVTETAVIEYVPVEPTVPAPVAPAPYIVEQTPYIIETAPAAQPSAPVSDVPTFGGPVQSSPAEVESNTGLIYIE